MQRTLLVGFISALLVACGDSTGILPEDIAGTWTATEFTATNTANASQTVDLIAAGARYSITFNADGTFSQTLVEPDGTIEADTGTFAVNGTTLTISESGSGSPTPVTATRDGNTMTMTRTEEFDFEDDGIDEQANLRLVLTRS